MASSRVAVATSNAALLESLDRQMPAPAAMIHERRRHFVDAFRPLFEECYAAISGGHESVRREPIVHASWFSVLGSGSGSNMQAILDAIEKSGADAVHPGYGFLSEKAEFAAMVEEHGFVFIGPSPDHIRMMGDKIAAKDAMSRLEVPLVPGSSPRPSRSMALQALV
mgnify:CR=1 FL=1